MMARKPSPTKVPPRRIRTRPVNRIGDFIVEEADSEPADHDFKIDLDSPHSQPHGQA